MLVKEDETVDEQSQLPKYQATRFLNELEKENEILERELQQLLNRASSSDNQMEMARFSFSNPVSCSIKSSDKKNQKAHESEQIPEMQDDQFDTLEQPYEFKFEPHSINFDEDLKTQCHFSSQKETQNNLQTSQEKIGKKLTEDHQDLKNYNKMLDNIMGSITSLVVNQDKKSYRHSSEHKKQQYPEEQLNISTKDQKIKSLEMRLSGTREALKAMEKEVKEKNRIIAQLQQDLNRKNKQIEIQQSQSKENIEYTNRTPLVETLSEIKKREKTLMSKLQDQDNIIKENKKYMMRLQELNSNLLQKIKQHEESNQNEKHNHTDNKQSEIIEDLKNKVVLLKKENQDLQKQYDHLKISSDEYLQKTSTLKEKYIWLLGRLEQITK